uniref:Putative secreted protein n=1 Tax=Ixodes ricinus TaxID=34613 RepID=A0A6B0TQS4_IXORI
MVKGTKSCSLLFAAMLSNADALSSSISPFVVALRERFPKSFERSARLSASSILPPRTDSCPDTSSGS